MTITDPKTEHSNFIDLLRITGAFGVILIHVSAKYLYRDNPVDWWAGNFWDSLSRFSVPVFVIISGYLLISSTESFEKAIRKRLMRILKPLVFWSLFFFGYKSFKDYLSTDVLTLNVNSFITGILKGNISVHLWYLYMISSLALITPVLSHWTKSVTSKEIDIFLIIWFVFCSLSFILENFFRISYPLYLKFFTGYAGYYILGYRFRRNENFLIDLKHSSFKYIILIICISLTMFGYKLAHNDEKTGDLFFYSYLSPNVIIIAIILFDLVRRQLSEFKIPRMLKPIAVISLGIYCIHPVIIQILEILIFNRIDILLYFKIPIIALTTLLISILVLYPVSKIKFLRPFVH